MRLMYARIPSTVGAFAMLDFWLIADISSFYHSQSGERASSD
jgi:hypothetical protein